MITLRLQRILFFLLCAAFLLGKVYILLAYVSVYYLSFEYLNSNKKYLEIPQHKIYNWLFIAYLAFIVLVRARLFHFSEAVNFHLNTAEHLFFTFLICQTISIYMQILGLKSNNQLLKLIKIFAILNLIGLLNEYFQNFYHHLPVFSLEENDIKDLIVNFIGSLLFVVISMISQKKHKLK